MRRRRNRDADILSRRLDRAADIIPEVFAHLHEQRHAARLGTAAPQDGPRAQGSHTDPTGSLVVAVSLVDTKHRAIVDALASVSLGVKLLEEACSKALGTIVRPTEGEPICHQAGCDEMVSSFVRDDGSVGYRLGGECGGLCDSHRAKAYRERAERAA